MRRALPAVVFALTVAGCGGSTQPVFGGSSTTLDGAVTTVGSGSTTATTGSSSSSSTGADTTTTTVSPLSALVDGASDPAATPAGDLGAPDLDTSGAIAAELAAAGVDLAGVEVYVYPILGTGERMLVLAADAAAEQLAGEGSNDLFEALPTLPTLAAGSDITRFTLHYYDTDAEGAFVLTTTMPLQTLFEYDGGDLPEGVVGVQLQRLP